MVPSHQSAVQVFKETVMNELNRIFKFVWSWVNLTFWILLLVGCVATTVKLGTFLWHSILG